MKLNRSDRKCHVSEFPDGVTNDAATAYLRKGIGRMILCCTLLWSSLATAQTRIVPASLQSIQDSMMVNNIVIREACNKNGFLIARYKFILNATFQASHISLIHGIGADENVDRELRNVITGINWRKEINGQKNINGYYLAFWFRPNPGVMPDTADLTVLDSMFLNSGGEMPDLQQLTESIEPPGLRKQIDKIFKLNKTQQSYNDSQNYITFTVMPDGSISEIETDKNWKPTTERTRIISAVKESEPWIPGTFNGRPLRSRNTFYMPK